MTTMNASTESSSDMGRMCQDARRWYSAHPDGYA